MHVNIYNFGVFPFSFSFFFWFLIKVFNKEINGTKKKKSTNIAVNSEYSLDLFHLGILQFSQVSMSTTQVGSMVLLAQHGW